MNSSQHRCMNQAPALENQTQQRSLNSSLEDTVGSPLVHLGGMLLNGSTSILPNSPLQPSVTSITYGPWYTPFATSLILDGPILPCTDGLQGYSSAYAALSGSRYISIGPSTALDTVFRPATAPFYQPYVPWMARPYTLEDFRNAASAPLGKHRRNRTAFSQQQLAALEQTFAKTQYPDLENRESLSRKTGLPEPKIQVRKQNKYMLVN
ncbi:hypothetical protein TNCV_1262831 [Trichonephila clavipes]|nr:hypothetical protein TNCV_1262831 [Trichonephila clavipes]